MNACSRTIVNAVLLVTTLPMYTYASTVAEQRRVALVIGNSDYSVAPLRNPRNDATDVASLLKEQLGFETQLVLDADQATMQRAIRDFSQIIMDADVRVFYYAGHGVSVDGVNYMIPVGADIKEEDEVQWEAVDTTLMLNTMEKHNTGANLMILDACRDNPLPRSTRSGQGGLDKMAAPVGSLIIYATAPGQVALDGTGRNGTFTKHLLRSLAAPGVHIGDVALDVRVAVMQETRNRQIPWSESSLTRRIYLAGQNQQETTLPVIAYREFSTTGTLPGTENEPVIAVLDDQPYEAAILAAYRVAAENGDAIAQASLGYIYDVGRSVTADKLKAQAWYERAARQQQRNAMVNLGVMYLTADGVPQDKAKAFNLFLKAAEAGHPVAQRNLGALYQFGDAVQQDFGKARLWFEKAADQGQLEAYVDLGDLYSRGLGVPKNERMAFAWYLKAAVQGSADAQSEVGYSYDQGLGVAQDYQQAFNWFKKAANLDNPTGTYNLAEMYELGKATAVDLEKARTLYRKALALGDDAAKVALARLGTQ